jgi:hypothetical protein
MDKLSPYIAAGMTALNLVNTAIGNSKIQDT